MKDVQKKLLAISTALSSLVQRVEKLAVAIEKGSAKGAPVKKKKAPAKKVKAKNTKAAPKKKVAAKKATPKKKAAKKRAAAAPKAKTAAGKPTMLDNILGIISRSRNGITVERLKKKTGLQARQVSNALYKLAKKGSVETLSRGLYVKKTK
jgi:hypothetical protein